MTHLTGKIRNKMGSIVYLNPVEKWEEIKQIGGMTLVEVGEVDDYKTYPIEIWLLTKTLNKIKDGTYSVQIKRRYIGIFSKEKKINEFEF